MERCCCVERSEGDRVHVLGLATVRSGIQQQQQQPPGAVQLPGAAQRDRTMSHQDLAL